MTISIVTVCPACLIAKPLVKSHVYPRGFFGIAWENDRSGPNARLITLSDAKDNKIDVSQDQGNSPILCRKCDAEIGRDFDKPAKEWAMTASDLNVSHKLNSDNLARFMASVFWRAGLSDHFLFHHMQMPEVELNLLKKGVYDSTSPFKTASYKIWKLVDSITNTSPEALKTQLLMFQRSRVFDNSGQVYIENLALMGGLVWQMFTPNFPNHLNEKWRMMQQTTRYYKLEPFDIYHDPKLLEHYGQQFVKHKAGKVSRAVEKKLTNFPVLRK